MSAPIRMFHAALPPEHDGIITTYEGQAYQWFGLGWPNPETMKALRAIDLEAGARVAALGHVSGVVAPELRSEVTKVSNWAHLQRTAVLATTGGVR